MMIWRLFSTVGFLFILAACSSGSTDSQQTTSEFIRWDRSPQTVVFRADVVNKDESQAFRARNEVPPCTIYGDNRIVWMNDLGDFSTQVLWDTLTDQQVSDFIQYLGIVEGIYEHDARADLQPPSDVAPIVETLSVSVNERQHVTDSFSDWEIDYFQRLQNVCKTITQSPILFEPQGAYVSAQEIPFDSSAPLLLWQGEAAGLRLSELASSGERRWITDQNVRILWEIMRTSSPQLIFQEGSTSYTVAMEVPGVTRDAPPAPAS
jgi:hypothetical protein